MEDGHKICELEKQIARLEQQAKDAATAVVLAKDVVSARWTSFIAIATSFVAIGIALLKNSGK